MFLVCLVAIVLAVSNLCFGLNANCNNQEDAPENTEARLRNDLFCKYERSVVVPKKVDWNSTTGVRTMVFLKDYSFDEGSSTLYAAAKMSMLWVDEFLTWNASDYDGIRKLQIDSDNVWHPRIAMHFNNGQHMDPLDLPNTKCRIESSSHVHCIFIFNLRLPSQTDHTDWPFDTHRSIATIGTDQGHSRTQLFITIYPIPTRQTHDRTWSVKLTESRRHMNGSCSFSLTLKRISAGELSFMLAPATVIVIINLLSLWLEPSSWERFWLLCINAYLHFMLIMETSWSVPSAGDIIPLIIKYFVVSLWTTAFLMILAFVNRTLSQYVQPLPAGVDAAINRLNGMVDCGHWFKCGGDYLNTQVRPGAGKGASAGVQALTKWIDRIVLLCLFIMYVVMIVNFIPTN